MKRIISLAACAAFMLTMGTTWVFAEEVVPTSITYPAADIQVIESPEQNPYVILIDGEAAEIESYSVEGSTYVRLSDMASALGFAKAVGSDDAVVTATAIELETKTEDGISYYSTDGGETWNELKSGVTNLQEKGKVKGVEGSDTSAITSPVGGGFSISDADIEGGITNLQESGKVGIFAASAQMKQYLINGEVFCNLRDLGKVLGYEVAFENDTILITKLLQETPIGLNASVMLKRENGVYFHSTDGGKTWIEGLPEGAAISE